MEKEKGEEELQQSLFGMMVMGMKQEKKKQGKNEDKERKKRRIG